MNALEMTGNVMSLNLNSSLH